MKRYLFCVLTALLIAAFGLPAAAQKIEFVKDLSIKTNENDEKTSFLTADRVEADSAGNIYVLASQERKIQVYDPTGGYLRTIGKRGQGPGEFEMPVYILLDSQDRLYVFDYMKAAFVVFDSAGKYLRNLSTKGRFQDVPLFIFQDSRGNFILGYDSYRDQSFRITRFDKEFEKGVDLFVKTGMVQLIRKPGGVTTQAPFAPEIVWTMDRDENIYVCYNKSYDIEVLSPEAKPIRTISRKISPDPVTKADVEEDVKRSRGLLAPGDFPKTKPVLLRVFTVERYLFVMVKRVAQTYLFHVFDPDGRFVEEMNLDFQPWLCKNGYVYTSKISPDFAESEVRRYKISLPAVK